MSVSQSLFSPTLYPVDLDCLNWKYVTYKHTCTLYTPTHTGGGGGSMKPSGKIHPPDQHAFEREINAVSREIKEKQSKLVSSWCWREVGGGEEGEIEILLAVLLGQVNYSSGTNQPTGVPKRESGCQCQQKLPNSIHPHTFQTYFLTWQTQGGHTN